MKNFLITIIIGILFLSGCSSTGSNVPRTPYKPPQLQFKATQVSEVKEKLIVSCAELEGSIQDAGSNRVVCDVPMGGGASFTEELLYGNSGFTPPFYRLQFIIYKKGEVVKVRTVMWAVSHTRSGQKQRPIKNKYAAKVADRIMYRAGGRDGY